ncbi:FecR domain-containing protein [Pseudomonas sp. MAFF 302030]|jgi:transmembrane sensor|uniref:FecR domain-containing protein n=1 Tax=Pseudomonas morbosilactucae TaxID=2938197 RepID=A0A9X1YZ21_9PSED|nr:FecR domain-containing protein [Pseudomonas morbosilactucae]MCK9800742.1 FecR domain-containing protein [Pseudomonas morbosilactucae]
MNPNSIDPQILGEAADWLVQLHSGTATAEDHQAIQQWRSRSAAHAQAWLRAEAILGDLRNVPAGIAVQTLQRAERRDGLSRRQTLTRLGLLLLAGPVGIACQQVSWEQWTADQRTAVGEQKNLQLPDGSHLLLNTDSSLDIAFNAQERRVRLLTGEVLISTAQDPGNRPFIVQTPQGTARALGTRFCVRINGVRSQVSVLEGAVQVRPQQLGEQALINAGERLSFKSDRLDPLEPFAASSLTWDKGMLMANNLRLAELLDELSRYRPGVLRCASEVAEIRVSGAFPLRDTEASLGLLQDTLPLRVSRLTRFWVSVDAAS